MALFLTPRSASTYQCGPFSCAPSRPSYRIVSRPTFVPFLSHVDELLSEIDREARRAAHQQRQQLKRAFRARFDVRENKEGYQVEGEVPGFKQENIEILVTDEYNLSVTGNTERKVESQAQPTTTPEQSATEPETTDGVAESEKMAGVTTTETEVHSDTESHKSYQATVEDDFEDLGAETSSTLSAPSEPKGKEKATEQPATETAVQQQAQQGSPAQEQEPESREWLNERIHGSFQRTFRFPARIDATNVSATLKDGVLSINVPKAPVPEVRNIAIQ